VDQGQPGRGAVSQNQTAVTTSNDGIFSFSGIDPGQYRIVAERDGYIRQEFGQRTYSGTGTIISISSGQNLTNINFQLTPAGTIAGRILDEDGEPLAGVQVQSLTYAYPNGRRTLVPGRTVETNDLGEYRLYWLTPGEYVVSAIPTRGRGFLARQTRNARFERASAEESYAPSYFPGSIDPETATPIQLPAVAEVRGIDFILRPVQTVTLRGRVVSPIPSTEVPPPPPRGQPQQGPRGGQLRQLAQNFRNSVQIVLSRSGSRGGGGRGGVGQPATAASADGGFEIRNVIPGSYTVTAVFRQNDQQYSARTRIEVNDRDVENINLALRPGIEVPGQIYLDGTPPAQFQIDRIRVGLVSTEDVPAGDTNTQVKPDATFVLSNVPALTYRVNITGLPAGAYAIAGRYGAVDALNEPFQIDGSQVLPLQVQIGFSAGRVDGYVTGRGDQPLPGATSVLIPAAPHRNRLDLYKTAATDQYGRFSFTSVAPGDYKVFAWEEVPQGAYQDPAFVSRFEDRGRPIRVEKGAAVMVQAPVIPANER
jgi:protocatechuate 3,4-dioxygenase beta subunit